MVSGVARERQRKLKAFETHKQGAGKKDSSWDTGKRTNGISGGYRKINFDQALMKWNAQRYCRRNLNTRVSHRKIQMTNPTKNRWLLENWKMKPFWISFDFLNVFKITIFIIMNKYNTILRENNYELSKTSIFYHNREYGKMTSVFQSWYLLKVQPTHQ